MNRASDLRPFSELPEFWQTLRAIVSSWGSDRRHLRCRHRLRPSLGGRHRKSGLFRRRCRGRAYLQGCRHAQRRQPARVPAFRSMPVALFNRFIRPRAALSRRLEQPIATTDLIPFGELIETEPYRQWAQPQGLCRFRKRGARPDDESGQSLFGVFRHERNGVVDDRARRNIKLITPHIRRAVLIGRMFEFKARGSRDIRRYPRWKAGSVSGCRRGRGRPFTPMPLATKFLMRATS